MRDDIHSVFTGGRGPRYPFARTSRGTIRDDDGIPVPGGRRFRHLEKGWQEHWCLRYRVLESFLRSRIGQPWDGIRSEVVQAVGDASSREKIIAHLDRIAWVRGGRLAMQRGVVLDEVEGFHIDRDGILREVPTRGYRDYAVRRANEHLIDPDSVRLGEGHGFERVDGIWYEVRWIDMEVGAIASDRRHYDSSRRALTFKRQLGKIEIDRFGLRDWPDLVAAFRASIRNRHYDRGLKARMEKAAETAGRKLAR